MRKLGHNQQAIEIKRTESLKIKLNKKKNKTQLKIHSKHSERSII